VCILVRTSHVTSGAATYLMASCSPEGKKIGYLYPSTFIRL
jgi:hypothetical protein